MSRRDRKRRTERRRFGRWLVAAAVVSAALVMGWLLLRPSGRDRAGEARAIASPAAGLSPELAYGKALELSRSSRFEESLPFFERALEGVPPEPWRIHYNLAGALYSAGLEERGPSGFSRPALRSSIERVAMMRRALAELDAAERLALTARDRATVIHERGVRLQVWGFAWDGFVELRRAQWTDPADRSHGIAADACMLTLEHPERGQPQAPRSRGALSPPASPP